MTPAMQRHTQHGVAYYQFADAGWARLNHGIFTRHGGHSPAPWGTLNVGGTVGDDPALVEANVQRAFAVLGLDRACAASVWQVHSADVVLATQPPLGRRWLARADGLVTATPGLTLAMRFADCAPVLLYDSVRRVVGMAHAGWRGTVQGVAANTALLMVQAFGCQPADIVAGVGPCIGPGAFQVGEEVVQAVQDHFGDTHGLVQRNPADGSAYLDLWAANKRDLARVGVTRVALAGLCTATRTDEFYSHRAEHGRTGRFLALACL